MSDSGAGLRAGYLYGLVAYVWWGLVPLYFRAVSDRGVPFDEMLAHRIVWSLPILLALTAVGRTWRDLWRVLRSRRYVGILGVSAALLAVNWLLYIYATERGRVSEASLGYYMMPLVNAALGAAVLGERLRPAHYPALGLVALGVIVPVAWAGEFTWIAVALPISFGVYGLVRKAIAVDGLTGLTVESLLMLPAAGGYIAYLWAAGRGHFGGSPGLDALLLFSGVVTVVPLLTFTLSIRRLPLLAVSFIQFLSPTIQMGLAVFYLGEELRPERLAAILCVWLAVLIFITDAVLTARAKKAQGRPALGFRPALTRGSA